MVDLLDLFDTEPGFHHMALFRNASQPWKPIQKIEEYITTWFSGHKGDKTHTETKPWGTKHQVRKEGGVENILFVESPILIEEDIFLEDFYISIGSGTLLEPTALIKGPAIIGSNCEIRQGAYMRGNVIIGDESVLGHTTEIKNSIIMNHSEAGHFAYIGDSLIGNYVNLGAGTKIANLQFRSVEEKRTGSIHTIFLRHGEERIDTGMAKIGALIGDGSELGCNCVTSPCTILGKNSAVYPSAVVKKGIYPNKSVIR